MDINTIREYFPYLKKGKIYFNHATTAPVSVPLIRELNKVLTGKSESNIDNYPEFLSVVDDTKSKLALLINAQPDRIGFLDNTSNGINILAQGIPWRKGDRVLLNNVEFPANVYPFLNLRDQGVEIDFVKAKNGIVTAEDIINMIKPETKLVAVSFVQFLSGYRIDLKKLGSVCKEKNIILSVDGIQGLGAVRLDIQNFNIDFISSGTQKWMLGLKGFGFIYVSKKLQEDIKPKYVGWLAVKNAWDFLNYKLELKESADALQGGTLNSLGIYALNTSLKIFEEFGHENVEKKILENTTYCLTELDKIGINAVLKEIERSNLAGIVSFKHNQAQRIFEELKKNNIDCSVREGMIRLSPHFYNTSRDIDKVINAIKNIVGRL